MAMTAPHGQTGKRKAEDSPVAEGDNISSGKRGARVFTMANT